jgi:ferredoxin--NADP+ reductase
VDVSQFNATLVDRQDITDSLFIIKIKPDFDIPDFLPGQYVALGLFPEQPRVAHALAEREECKPGKLIKRTYSIGSSPHQKEAIEFYIALVNDGCFTPRLLAIQPGDRLWMAQKITGTFSLEGVSPEKNLIFVATGTGLAPFIAMLRTPSIWDSPMRHVTLLHGVRFPQDLAYAEELRALEKQQPNFSYFSTVSRADSSWQGKKGYIQNFFTDKLLTPDLERDHIFLCGNPGMVEEVERLLTLSGFSVHSKRNPGNLHLEKYW